MTLECGKKALARSTTELAAAPTILPAPTRLVDIACILCTTNFLFIAVSFADDFFPRHLFFTSIAFFFSAECNKLWWLGWHQQTFPCTCIHLRASLPKQRYFLHSPAFSSRNAVAPSSSCTSHGVHLFSSLGA